MANETVRFTPGQFTDPNSDSNKLSANNDTGTATNNAINGLVVRQLVNQAKGTTITIASRKAQRSGNISLGDKITKTVSLVGDVTMLAGAWLFGPVAGGIATVGLGIQKGLEANEISHQLQMDDLTAREDARRAGVPVDDRGGFR